MENWWQELGILIRPMFLSHVITEGTMYAVGWRLSYETSGNAIGEFVYIIWMCSDGGMAGIYALHNAKKASKQKIQEYVEVYQESDTIAVSFVDD
jgi:hypothetical protein